MARDKLSYMCTDCGTVHHIEYGSALRTECPACWETWDVAVMYRALRPRMRHGNGSYDGEQSIPGELKQQWKQSLPQFNNISSWRKLDGFDLGWILSVCPECVRQVPLKKLSSEDWHFPLQVNAKLLKPFWTVCFGSSHQISRVLCSDISMIQHVDVSRCMEPRHWWAVLDVHPDLLCATPNSFYAEMPIEIWVQALKGHPKSWVEEKAPWALFSGSNWQELLLARPELATHCDWHKLVEQDWYAILFSPTTPFLWPLIHDVLCGRNLICIVEHAELLKYLDWDNAPLPGLRELIIGSNLDIKPPSWNKLSARIVGEKSFWQYRKSVRQFIPPSMPVGSTSWTDESFEKVDLSEVPKFEGRLALLCFMGWELVYFANSVKMQEMNAALLVEFPSIGKKYGWKKLPVEMHYGVVRKAPWLREYYPWTEWAVGKLIRLFSVESAFKTEYRKKHPYRYIFVRIGLTLKALLWGREDREG